MLAPRDRRATGSTQRASSPYPSTRCDNRAWIYTICSSNQSVSCLKCRTVDCALTYPDTARVYGVCEHLAANFDLVADAHEEEKRYELEIRGSVRRFAQHWVGSSTKMPLSRFLTRDKIGLESACDGLKAHCLCWRLEQGNSPYNRTRLD